MEAYRGADPAPVLDELVEDTAAVSLDGVTITLRRDRYVALDVAALPGLPLLLLGAMIVLAGVMTSAFWGPVRVPGSGWPSMGMPLTWPCVRRFQPNLNARWRGC